MRRRLTAMLAMVVMTGMAVASPAWAAQGGFPNDASCGLGQPEAHAGIARARPRQGQASSRGSLPQRQAAPVRDRAALAGPGCRSFGPSLVPIHRGAWKGNSANFGRARFSELRLFVPTSDPSVPGAVSLFMLF